MSKICLRNIAEGQIGARIVSYEVEEDDKI